MFVAQIVMRLNSTVRRSATGAMVRLRHKTEFDREVNGLMGLLLKPHPCGTTTFSHAFSPIRAGLWSRRCCTPLLTIGFGPTSNVLALLTPIVPSDCVVVDPIELVQRLLLAAYRAAKRRDFSPKPNPRLLTLLSAAGPVVLPALLAMRLLIRSETAPAPVLATHRQAFLSVKLLERLFNLTGRACSRGARNGQLFWWSAGQAVLASTGATEIGATERLLLVAVKLRKWLLNSAAIALSGCARIWWPVLLRYRVLPAQFCDDADARTAHVIPAERHPLVQTEVSQWLDDLAPRASARRVNAQIVRELSSGWSSLTHCSVNFSRQLADFVDHRGSTPAVHGLGWGVA
jgi:hypothetical protein